MSNIAEVPDVLLLIFEQLLYNMSWLTDDVLVSRTIRDEEPMPKNLIHVVLVSRLWNELATPLLWRRATLVAIWSFCQTTVESL